jgi:hypothetical protein
MQSRWLYQGQKTFVIGLLQLSPQYCLTSKLHIVGMDLRYLLPVVLGFCRIRCTKEPFCTIFSRSSSTVVIDAPRSCSLRLIASCLGDPAGTQVSSACAVYILLISFFWPVLCRLGQVFDHQSRSTVAAFAGACVSTFYNVTGSDRRRTHQLDARVQSHAVRPATRRLPVRHSHVSPPSCTTDPASCVKQACMEFRAPSIC